MLRVTNHNDGDHDLRQLFQTNPNKRCQQGYDQYPVHVFTSFLQSRLTDAKILYHKAELVQNCSVLFQEEKDLKDYYKNTRECIDEYNEIVEKVFEDTQELTDELTEKLDHHCIYLAHALLKDAGPGATARQELSRMCDVIKAVLKGDAYES